MGRARKTLPLLAILFFAMLSNGERFGHVAKAQTIASVLLKSAAKALLAMNRTRATRDAKLSKPEF